MLNILLYIASFMIAFSYLFYIMMIFVGRYKIVSKSNSMNVSKDIISEYNSINIVESKSYFTIYNIKRRVIKLASRCYYGKDISSISLALIEASISVIDNMGNKYIDMFRYIFYNLKILYIFPILSLFISNSTYNVSDAKVSIILIGIMIIINYLFINIKNDACIWISDNLSKIDDINKDNRKKVISYISKLLWLDRFILYGEIIMFIRCILILMEIY